VLWRRDVVCLSAASKKICFSSLQSKLRSLQFPMAEQLKILNWNVRGLNSPVRREVVRQMVQAYNPILVCLQETKLVVINQQIVSDTLGQRFDGFHVLPAVGTRGGILFG
jgi:hypothetical protein